MIKITRHTCFYSGKCFLYSMLFIAILFQPTLSYSQDPGKDTYTQTPKFTNPNQANRVGTFKGLFINNFIKYVSWPEKAVEDTFNLVVLNDKVLEKILKRATRRITFGADSLPIKVIYMDDLSEVSGMDIHMLYSDYQKNNYSAEDLFEAVEGKPTLLITENYDYGTTMINFLTVDIQQKFEINVNNTKAKGLEVDPKMLEYASKTSQEVFEKYLSSVRTISTVKTKLDKEKSINVEQTKKIKDLSKDIQEKTQTLELMKQQSALIQKNIELQNKQAQRLKYKLDSNSNVIAQKEAEIAISNKLHDKQMEQIESAQAELEDIEQKRNDAMVDLKNQRTMTYVSVVVLFIVAFLLFIALRNYRKQKEQSLIITKQKEEVEGQRDEISKQHVELEEKNKEITDSINYAQRIQEAILPPSSLFDHYLKNYFIFYAPKDIVAGDFYWMQAVGNTVAFAAADCTGHGVPGALVSTLCSNALDRAVKEYNLLEPAKILDKTLEIILEQFTQAEETVKDGMDISLCSFNIETRELQYAGANNPLWIHRKGTNEIEEYTPNKQPIGAYLKLEPFVNHKTVLNEGDSIYIFSDGYADQFGGERGKKYKTFRFRNLILSIKDKSIQEQNKLIQKAHYDWRGDEEQLDDICVIGFRA